MIKSSEPSELREGLDEVRAAECTCVCKGARPGGSEKAPASDRSANDLSLDIDVNDPT